MKTKVELDIPEKSLDAASKKVINDLKKKIRSLERQLEKKESTIYDLKQEVQKCESLKKHAKFFVDQIDRAIGDYGLLRRWAEGENKNAY